MAPFFVSDRVYPRHFCVAVRRLMTMPNMNCSTASSRIARLLPALLLLIHALLVGHGATVHSPVLDETGHLPCGLAILTMGRFDLYPQNPPLVKTVAASPLLLVSQEEDWSAIDKHVLSQPQFLMGYDWINANGARAFDLFTLARWACMPFTLLGGAICYLWARTLYGRKGGILSLALWCFSPSVLGNAQFLTPDVAAASVALAAHYMFWRWLTSARWWSAVAAGVLLGGANLCKFTWVVLPPIWVVTSLAWFYLSSPPAILSAGFQYTSDTSRPRNGLERRIGPYLSQLGVALILALLVINAGYGFRGSFRRLGDFQFYSRTLSGRDIPYNDQSPGANRFQDSELANMLLPLPCDYIRGIDLQKRDFELGFEAFLRGRWKKGGWWYYYLYGLAVKTPIGTIALFALAAGLPAWSSLCHLAALPRQEHDRLAGPEAQSNRGVSPPCRHQASADEWAHVGALGGGKKPPRPLDGAIPFAPRPRPRDELILLLPAAIVVALVSSQTGINMFMRYILPAQPFVYVWMGKLALPQLWSSLLLRGVVVACMAYMICSSLFYHPHSASYFNELVGGPEGGVEHLLDANVGWGQDLLFLKRWFDDHPNARPLGVAYFGNADPKVAGIDFFLPPRGSISPNQNCVLPDAAEGPQPGWYAIDVSFTRGMRRHVVDEHGDFSFYPANGDFSYFQHFSPVGRAGYSIYIYHITREQANEVRKKLGITPLPGRENE